MSEREETDIEREHLCMTDARARILAHMRTVPPIDRNLTDVCGCVLASAVMAPGNLPPFDQSAMDGFAICAADTSEASPSSPVVLTVARTIAAGDDAGASLAPGTCCRIMTGAMMPEGATAMIELEWDGLRAENRTVVITGAVATGRHIRRAGEQVAVGTTIARAGDIVTPARLGLLASVGVGRVAVRRPRVALIATGKELMADRERSDAGVYDALSPMLTGYIAALGGEVVRRVMVGDDPVVLREHCATVIREDRPDLLVTTAGISMGDHDVVRAAFANERDVTFATVRMKPGQPLAFGLVDGVPFLGVPGNPLAAAVSFLQFGVPAIRRLAGVDSTVSRAIRARAAEPFAADRVCERIVCAVVGVDGQGQLTVRQVGRNQRQSLASLAAANCLVTVPCGDAAIAAGDLVETVLLPKAAPVVWPE